VAAKGRETNKVVRAPSGEFPPATAACFLNIEHEPSAIVGRLVALEHDHNGLGATFTSDELKLLHNAAVPWYLESRNVRPCAANSCGPQVPSEAHLTATREASWMSDRRS
jgi:hypothetical protein